MTDTPHLFNKGWFYLHSGGVSGFKIDCDALTDEDLEALAIRVATQLRWSDTVSIPTGGDRFREALRKWTLPACDLPRLIVDDVWTTGQSMEDVRESWENLTPEARPCIGVVIFARSPTPPWVHPIFSMWGS